MKHLERGVEAEKTNKDVHAKLEAQFNLSLDQPRLQDQPAIKRISKTHTNSVLNDPHMDINIIS